MTRRENAIRYVLGNEGGYSQSVHDPGLATKFGISSRYNPGVDVEALTLDGAAEIYKNKYWLKEYDEIPGDALAIKLFDFAVNAGHARAHSSLQRALNYLLGTLLPPGQRLKVDGILGEKTLAAVRSADESEVATSEVATSNVLDEFTVQMILFYAGRPHWQRYKVGWTRRAVRVPIGSRKSR